MTGMQDSANPNILLTIIGFAVFMATLDTSIINISLPTIAASFGTDMASVSWIVMAYLLVLSGLMLACGKLGDLHGFRRVFIAGLVLFSLGSLLCGFAWNLGLLVAFRVLQGTGAAAIGAIAPAMITVCLPAGKRGWALGILMTIVSVAIASGPILGGFITEYLGWNWVFFVNVPVGIVAVILATRYLPDDSRPVTSGRFDTAGAVLALLALFALLCPLNFGLYLGWTSPVVAGMFALSVLLFGIFVIHEQRCECPLVDLRIFSSRNFLLGNVAGMLVLLAFAGSEFLLPFYFETVRGISTEVAGMLLAIPAITLMLAGPVAGTISDRHGPGGLMTAAALLSAATLYLFSWFGDTTAIPFIIVALVLEGLSVGLFMPPDMSLIMGSGSRESGGVASGVMMMLRNVGAMFGVAILGTIAMQGIPAAGPGTGMPVPGSGHPEYGIHAAFFFAAIVCLLVAAISWTVRQQKTSPADS